MVVTVEAAEIELLDHKPPFSRNALVSLGLRGLHCGCGMNVQKHAWLNTDHLTVLDGKGVKTQAERLARITIGDSSVYYLEHDVIQEFPFENGAFDWIYSEHFIEHISPTEAVSWLKECRRLLSPGGIMRITTPNLRTYAEAYMDRARGGSFFAEHHERLMSAWKRSSEAAIEATTVEGDLREWVILSNPGVSPTEVDQLMRDPALREDLLNTMHLKSRRPAFLVNQIFRMWGHKWIYDFDEIKFIGQEADFSPDSIGETSFQQGAVRDVYLLDHPWHNDETLYVELRKPSEV
jgi:SAM-dependent methyltransferase